MGVIQLLFFEDFTFINPFFVIEKNDITEFFGEKLFKSLPLHAFQTSFFFSTQFFPPLRMYVVFCSFSPEMGN